MTDTARRAFLGAWFALAPLLPLDGALAETPAPTLSPPLEQLAELERRHGGRLGVAILDTATGRRINHRGEERFPMASTFKWLLVAQVLQRVDAGEESLDRRVVFPASDLVSYSPVTEQHAGEPGMTVAELCEAAITWSDNTAANLLLATVGGPEGFTAFARSLGDEWTRLDRIEPDLNEATPGDPRDTTTPAAMLRDLHVVLLGDVLSTKSRDRLTDWLIANRTGDDRLRAGLPGWRVGDKTGSGMHAATNDLAIAWPADGGAPLLVTVYYAEAEGATSAERKAVIAEIGGILANMRSTARANAPQS